FIDIHSLPTRRSSDLAFKELFQVPHLGNIAGMQKRHPELHEKTMELKAGKQQMATLDSNQGKIKLLIQNSNFETNYGHFRIVVRSEEHTSELQSREKL